MNVDQSVVTFFVGLILGNIGSLLRYLINWREDMVIIQTKLDTCIKDIDGVARIVGTDRSKNNNQKTEKIK